VRVHTYALHQRLKQPSANPGSPDPDSDDEDGVAIKDGGIKDAPAMGGAAAGGRGRPPGSGSRVHTTAVHASLSSIMHTRTAHTTLAHDTFYTTRSHHSCTPSAFTGRGSSHHSFTPSAFTGRGTRGAGRGSGRGPPKVPLPGPGAPLPALTDRSCAGAVRALAVHYVPPASVASHGTAGGAPNRMALLTPAK
jgi:hypothetical protein